MVDLYDFSEVAVSMMGNELATEVVIPAVEKAKMLALLAGGTSPGDDPDALLLRLLIERFTGYLEVEKWCHANGIACTKRVNLWP